MDQAGTTCPKCQGNVLPKHDLLLCVQCGHIAAYIDQQPPPTTRNKPRPEQRPMGLNADQALKIFINPKLTAEWLRNTMWPTGPGCPTCGAAPPRAGKNPPPLPTLRDTILAHNRHPDGTHQGHTRPLAADSSRHTHSLARRTGRPPPLQTDQPASQHRQKGDSPGQKGQGQTVRISSSTSETRPYSADVPTGPARTKKCPSTLPG